ncbi:response regulator transcription factor [Paraburkholderia sediminicola]|uniref:response regulator transcription factor n=1 Tax=Paraburkholderia sediminicola TaxID=458836 RepID=UPI0038B6D5A5
MATALFIDDHAMFREGVVLAIGQGEPDLQIRTASSGVEALRALRVHADIAIVLTDYYLPDTDGTELIEQILQLRPQVPVMVLSGSDHPDDRQRALAAGAYGFVHKSADSEALLDAVRRALRHEQLPPQYGEPAAGTPMNSTDEAMRRLTPRQFEVLWLLCEGLRNGDIANRLNMSEKTVKAHVSGIFAALEVPNRTQAVLMAMRSRSFKGRKGSGSP